MSRLFDIPLKQHYSQTLNAKAQLAIAFDIPLKQHYSQTSRWRRTRAGRFDIPLKQHYSQTRFPIESMVWDV